MRASLGFGLPAGLLWLVCAAPGFAMSAELEAPDVTPGIAASSLIHLTIVAGTTGAPNGFTIEWMRASEFDALGGWPSDSENPALHSALFLGTPTLNTVEGTTSFLLGGNAQATVQIGDIFDETGILSDDRDEMTSGTEYVFHVRANGDGSTSNGGAGLFAPSPFSETYRLQTQVHDDRHECVHTQGYWKNHPDAWPVGLVTLGSVIYTKAQLLQIFDEPAAGNGLISLAHQLIAAKLNVAGGAVPPSLIVGVINTADALISSRIVPPIGTGYLPPGTTSRLTDDLEEFNDDEMNHEDCDITPTKRPTWGQLKAMYR